MGGGGETVEPRPGHSGGLGKLEEMNKSKLVGETKNIEVNATYLPTTYLFV